MKHHGWRRMSLTLVLLATVLALAPSCARKLNPDALQVTYYYLPG